MKLNFGSYCFINYGSRLQWANTLSFFVWKWTAQRLDFSLNLNRIFFAFHWFFIEWPANRLDLFVHWFFWLLFIGLIKWLIICGFCFYFFLNHHFWAMQRLYFPFDGNFILKSFVSPFSLTHYTFPFTKFCFSEPVESHRSRSTNVGL